MSVEERGLSSDDRWAGVVWCAKEAMYKYYGRSAIDLQRDLRIVAVDGVAKCVYGVLPNGERVEIKISLHEGKYIVATAVSMV